MAITLNNINFTRVSKLGVGSPITMVRKAGMSETAMNTIIGQSSDSATTADALGVVNAVEIDWNGAELGTINDINLGTIYTTGDLLNAIKALANANKYTA